VREVDVIPESYSNVYRLSDTVWLDRLSRMVTPTTVLTASSVPTLTIKW
jgi:hypothetical protein